MGTIYVLWSGEYDERVAVAGFRSREAIPAWIGDLCLNRDLTPLDGPLEVTELELVEPEEFNATDLEAIASVIGRGRTGRPWHETRSTPGGVKDMETAREVAQVVGQRIADARAIAAQDAQQQRGSDIRRDHLAAVLGESAPEAMDASWGRLMELVRERSERLAELETRSDAPRLQPRLWKALEPAGISPVATVEQMLELVRALAVAARARADRPVSVPTDLRPGPVV